MKITKNMIIDCGKLLAEILDVPVLKIEFVNQGRMVSDTQMAAFATVQNEAKIQMIKKTKYDQFAVFALAHEYRHWWQYLDNDEKWLKHHKSNSELNSLEYNMQPEEIDANAFGLIAMANILGLEPIFPNLPEEYMIKVKERAIEIVEALNS